jgi:hypothetical protein
VRARTLIYLNHEDLDALRTEARGRGISLAELMRRIVRDHVTGRAARRRPNRDTYMKLVGLGSSGRRDISERHDVYIAEALRREHSR